MVSLQGGAKGKPQDYPAVDVLVLAINVCKHVMELVVLNFPVVGIGAQQVHCQPHQAVYLMAFRIPVMIAVVHHRHSHSGNAYAHHQVKHQHEPIRHWQAEYEDKGKDIKR